MNHKTLILIVTLSIAAVSAAQAQAGTRDPRINARQHTQHDRIRQGVRSGELTRHETRQVAGEQRDVRQLERAYKSDGTLTGRERHDLQHEQNQASRDIYRQKHDAQDRPDATSAARDPGVNSRQAHQTERLAQGVKSGELTGAEAQGLRSERRDIRESEQTYKSDGTLNRDERQDLHRQLNQQSHDIAAEKHDGETR